MKILNKLTLKHLLMNKRRTIVTIIGVILSTALMVGIGLIVSSFRDSMVKDTIRFNGEQHVTITNLNEEQSKKIENYYSIKKIGKLNFLNGNDTVEIVSIDKKYLEKFKYVGNLPSNTNEIMIPKSFGYVDYSDDEQEDIKIVKKEINDEIEINSKKYKVVGIYSDITESGLAYQFGDYLYTIGENKDSNTYLITFKNPKKAYDYIDEISKDLNLSYENINDNTELLAYYGASKYSNFMSAATSIIIIVLTLVSLACIIVIYNSFAISVMERKKQFGLFSSIGATKSQLIKTVYFEAFTISLIGIPLGILSAYLGIGIVIKITNNLLSLGSNVLELSTYPLFIIIPILFMIITILISAFIPSIKASRISPIEAIRLNDDIKIKSKKVKTSKLIRKIFGIEGELALKNIKRNRKKYSVTIVSLFISTVLFITFSSFINYIIGGASYLAGTPEVDIYISGDMKQEDKKAIIDNKDVDDYVYVEEISFDYNKNNAYIYVLEDYYYNNLLKKMGKTERKPIIHNVYKTIEYDNVKKTRVIKLKNKFDKVQTIKLDYSYYTCGVTKDDFCDIEFNDYYLVDETTPLLDSYKEENVYLFVTKDMISNYDSYDKRKSLLLKSKNDVELTNFIKETLDIEKDEDENSEGTYVLNLAEEYRLEKNLIIVIKMFVYGFIGLVTLIGVTSVINTINTSIALRRKEFAILRSIGLNKKGFNKMIYFESLFFGLKSLVFSLPVSGIIIYLIHKSMTEVIEFESLMLPITQMIYAIIGVFLIVLLTMLYASHKIKKDNILEAIREENI